MKRSFWHARPHGSQGADSDADSMDAPVDTEPTRPPRRFRALLALALFGALGGFLISYLLPARYTSTSTVLVEAQKVPEEYVHPLITSNLAERVQILSQEILSPVILRPVIHDLALVPPDQEGQLIGVIQQNMVVDPVITSMSASVAADKTPNANGESVPGFNIRYTDTNDRRAQIICNALTSLIVTQNLKSRSEIAQNTVDFLRRQLEDAKHALDDQDAKLTAFKKQNMGQLPINGRTATSPLVEEEYNALTRDNDTALALYKDLLAKRNSAELSASMETAQEGEQMHIAVAASLPELEFPDRGLIALAGLCVSLFFGVGRLLWPAAK